MNYYNEFEPYAAAWLRNLIAAGRLPAGEVDERDIRQVLPGDLKGYTQVHLFCGIGGWPYALGLAGIPATRPLWTGSCPCQPYSAAGKRQGDADARNLWPEFYRLIRECRPASIFGEQVASAIGFGWLDGICADLESQGYACGAAVLPACSVGAPHIRQRLFWLAFAPGEQMGRAGLARQGAVDRLGFAERAGLEGHPGHGDDRDQPGRLDAPAAGSAWAASELIQCGDGQTRRIGAGIQPLAYGVPARVGKLRAAGNAIVPPLAAEFIKASW